MGEPQRALTAAFADLLLKIESNFAELGCPDRVFCSADPSADGTREMFSAGLDHLLVPRAAFDGDGEATGIFLGLEFKLLEGQTRCQAFLERVDSLIDMQHGFEHPRLDFGQDFPDLFVGFQGGGPSVVFLGLHKPQAVDGDVAAPEVLSRLFVRQHC